MERKKQEAIIAEATKGIVAYSKLSNPSEEQTKQYQELLQVIREANRDIQIEAGKHEVELQRIRDEAAQKRIDEENKAWEERRKQLAKEAAAFKLGLKDQREQAAEDFGKINEDINKGIKSRFEAFLKNAAKISEEVMTRGEQIRGAWKTRWSNRGSVE